MRISARNQLKGTIRSVKLGTIMSEVTVDVGGQEIVAAITRGSAEGLGLQERVRGDRHHQGHGGDDRDRLVRPAGATVRRARPPVLSGPNTYP
jgi:molybdopterin-binding protein